ncbi:MAG: hypothetical protein U1F36_16780 [Planctomycetota bacterium]
MMQRTLLAALLASGALAAQGIGPYTNGDYLFLLGYSDSQGPTGPSTQSYPVSRFKDLNGDGAISDSNELFAFLKVSYNTRNLSGGILASFMSDMSWCQEGDNIAFYIADSADGRITRGVDSNNNGVLDNNEVTEFFDFQSAFAPDGIAVHRDNAGVTHVYVALDDSASPYGPGIHELIDGNGDGDAKDAGEQTPFVNAAMGLTVAGSAGTVTLTSMLFEQVSVLDNGTVLAYSRGSSSATTANSPDQYAWYAFNKVGGVTTASVFFNPSQANGLVTHPDFAAGGTFPQWDVVVGTAPNTKVYSDVQFFAAAPPTLFGPRDYFFGAAYNNPFRYLNPSSVPVHGLFYRWRDANSNFAIDAGEITLWANFSGNVVAGVQPFALSLSGGGSIPDLNQQVFTIEAKDGQLHVCWGSGSTANKSWALLQDTNSNGVIETGEARQSYAFSSAANPVYHPSFGPFIKDASAFGRGFMPGPFPAGLTPYGQGCALPSNGLAPVCDAFGGMPQVGNASFGVAVERVPFGAGMYLEIGLSQASTPLPPGLGGGSNCILLTDLAIGVFGPFAADTDGVAGLQLPIPAVPALAGGNLDTQWLTIAAVGPNVQLFTSNALQITIQP